jgi:tetratricopeptide (TPR) repeat protein
MGWRIVVLFMLLLVILSACFGCSLPPEGSPDWYLDYADELASKGQYEEAIEEYTIVIKANATTTTRVRAYINRAAAYINLERHDEAICDCTEAITLDPERVRAYLYRATAYNTMGDYELAIADCARVIEMAATGDARDSDIDSIVVEAYIQRAYAYYKIGELNSALTDCDSAIDIDPEQPYAYFNRGLVYKGLGMKAEAISDFEKSITLSDNLWLQEKAMREIEELSEEETTEDAE